MRVIEKIERFFDLDKEDKEVLRKASNLLYNMGEVIENLGEISLRYAKFTNPVEQVWNYDEKNLYDFAGLLSAFSQKERIDIE